MVRVRLQYLVDGNQQRKAVVISVKDWARIVEELEELDDIRAYDKAKAGPQDAVPFEQCVHEIDRIPTAEHGA